MGYNLVEMKKVLSIANHSSFSLEKQLRCERERVYYDKSEFEGSGRRRKSKVRKKCLLLYQTRPLVKRRDFEFSAAQVTSNEWFFLWFNSFLDISVVKRSNLVKEI